MGDHALFFYGTLLHPQILHRVIHGPSNPTFASPSTSYITTAPALLFRHRRHRVKGADYPAVVPCPSDEGSETASVRGTLASGLTSQDVRRLDIFEGEEYERRRVKVRCLRRRDHKAIAPEEQVTLLSAPVKDEGKGHGGDLLAEEEETEAQTYIWIAGQDRLEEQEWDFEEFKREKMRFWIGGGGEEGETGREEFGAVDAGAQAGEDGTGGRRVDGAIGRELDREHNEYRAEPARSAV